MTNEAISVLMEPFESLRQNVDGAIQCRPFKKPYFRHLDGIIYMAQL